MPGSLHYYAVVTGDIVRSGRLPAEKFRRVQGAIEAAGRHLEQQFPGKIPFPIELARGDSWQLFLRDPADALRAGLYVRAFIRAEAERVDTRVAIGVGTVETMPKRSVGDGRGEAFRLSGELIEKKRAVRLRIAISQEHPGGEREERALAAMLAAIDVIASRWTSAQALAVRGALLGWTQEQIAGRWPRRPITQQSAGEHLARAGWDGVSAVIDYYEEAMKGSQP